MWLCISVRDYIWLIGVLAVNGFGDFERKENVTSTIRGNTSSTIAKSG